MEKRQMEEVDNGKKGLQFCCSASCGTFVCPLGYLSEQAEADLLMLFQR
jgi:hypothetical protein